MDTFLIVLQIIGTISFAISGAVLAIEHKMDLLGVVLLGTITAVGGGVIRDTVLGNYPIEMFKDPTYLLIGLITSLIVFIVFFFYHKIEITNSIHYKRIITLLDAIGLGVFVVIGAQVAYNTNHTSLIVISFAAVITAIGGGVIRDIMCQKMPVIFTKYIYCLATIVEAMLYYFLVYFKVNIYVSASISIIFIVILRMIAFHFKLSLPKVPIPEDFKEED